MCPACLAALAMFVAGTGSTGGVAAVLIHKFRAKRSVKKMLAGAFSHAANSLSTLQQNVDLSVSQSVSQINGLTSRIAKLNVEVASSVTTGQNAGSFIDQRQQLTNELSNLVDVSTIEAGDGTVTLTSSDGVPLVVGGLSFDLTSQADPATGLQHVFSQGTDVTSKISAGQLAGQLQVRDQELPAIKTSLDSLAAGLANSLNTQHQAGFDLQGAPGGTLFTPPPAGGVGAAASFEVAITDPSKIAASGGPAPGSAGDNTNANALLALKDQSIINNQTPLNFYSGLVFKIGNDVSFAQGNQQSGSQVLQQLQNLQGGVSGVSINEEAANLVRYQTAYSAAAHVASVIDSLLQDTINILS